ncbi:hypothetical protein [Glycomyces sp. NPDC048151]|uniref:hypothetical protein n=1 Tax=Glycomyces sp. NPDC048151 TaxID=3364002 RepID=UPI00371CB107
MDQHDQLLEGNLYWADRHILTGRIEWLFQGGNYAAIRLHVNPLTKQQVDLIGDAHLGLKLAFQIGDTHYGLEEGTMRIDAGLRPGAEEVMIFSTGDDGWKLNF